MTKCCRCERQSTLYLCNTCMERLRRDLRDLPWWLDRLAETALGQVRMGDGGRRYRREADGLVKYTDPEVGDERLEADIVTGKLAVDKVLAAAHINTRASDEYQRVHNTLNWWIVDLCETRSIEPPRMSTAIGSAAWLAKQAHAIASQENANRCCDDVAGAIRAIERCVNRPVPPRIIGPCITDPAPDELLAKRRVAGDRTTRCNHRLSAPPKARSVTCPQCAQTHPDVEEIVNRNLAEMDDLIVTIRDLVDWILPRLNEPVSQRNLERWTKRGWLPVRGLNEQGHQMVRLGDVRRARAGRPRHARAG